MKRFRAKLGVSIFIEGCGCSAWSIPCVELSFCCNERGGRTKNGHYKLHANIFTLVVVAVLH